MVTLGAPIEIDLPATLKSTVTQIRLLKDERIKALIEATQQLEFFAIDKEVSPLDHERGLPHLESFGVLILRDSKTPALPLPDFDAIQVFPRAVLDSVNGHGEGVRLCEVLVEGIKKSLRKFYIGVEKEEDLPFREACRSVAGAREAEVLWILLNPRETATEILEHFHTLIFGAVIHDDKFRLTLISFKGFEHRREKDRENRFSVIVWNEH